jgi:hypothetical protein
MYKLFANDLAPDKLEFESYEDFLDWLDNFLDMNAFISGIQNEYTEVLNDNVGW